MVHNFVFYEVELVSTLDVDLSGQLQPAMKMEASIFMLLTSNDVVSYADYLLEMLKHLLTAHATLRIGEEQLLSIQSE